jgi:DtxR family Mn-dependent transcriptional regulator
VSCPHGNIIPGLEELGIPPDARKRAVAAGEERAESMTAVATKIAGLVTVLRISEQVQSDPSLMLKLKRIGIQPGREVTLAASDEGVRVTSEDRVGSVTAELPRLVAAHVFVSRR